MTGWQYSYVYGGAVSIGDTERVIEGTASSPERCDERRLRALVERDTSRSEGVPLDRVEIRDFWFSEITGDTGAPDPFRPHGVPDAVDPFRPGDT